MGKNPLRLTNYLDMGAELNRGERMGLDMFLDGVWREGEKTCREQVIYWRKANAVHRWFVSNAQDGVDNCARYSVSRKQLEMLMNCCQTVLDDMSKAEELLPTASGFFFGDTSYGEDYAFDLKYTVEKIREVLSDEKYEFFEYMSWW